MRIIHAVGRGRITDGLSSGDLDLIGTPRAVGGVNLGPLLLEQSRCILLAQQLP
ncbi:hypothetical protein Poly59_40150 [Rubripirellula reticaptiva]|uniref:Uncharacterized protein n=1 Tax=Rubripirellula reticaptiva TaxID=2528013 RepID=A0A5C6ELX9_9BACT|nr:hypothetical protein Poly59_40150 [Rubripirellula reticaptiva]